MTKIKKLSSRAALQDSAANQRKSTKTERLFLKSIEEIRAGLSTKAKDFLKSLEEFNAQKWQHQGVYYMTSDVPSAYYTQYGNLDDGVFEEYFLAIEDYCHHCGFAYKRPVWASTVSRAG